MGQRHKIIGGLVMVLLPILHPVEAKCRGPVIQPLQAIHPVRLFRKRDVPEANQRHANAARDKACD